MTRLTIATCQFPVTADVAANAAQIRRQIAEAAAAGADVAHFPENAITGNLKLNGKKLAPCPSGNWRQTWRHCDWALIRAETEGIRQACRDAGIWAVVGSSHSFDPEKRPTNCIYVFDAAGAIVERYDKRRCSESDLANHTPGDQPVTFAIKGIACGITMGLEWSFPDIFMDYAEAGVDLLFHSGFAAQQERDTIHTHTVPQVMQGHAFNANLFISVSNAANALQALPSFWVRRSGRRGGTCGRNATAVLVSEIFDEPEKDELYHYIRNFRRGCRDGSFYAPHVSDDPRRLLRHTLG